MPEPGLSRPHAPTHRLSEAGVYIVTAATYQKAHHFRGRRGLDVLHRGLLKLAATYGWRLEAWAVFSNHYHFVAHSPAEPGTLRALVSELHCRTAGWVNRLDDQAGRKVWHNYWESRSRCPKAYWARLNYVHQNAVHHGLVPVEDQYPWCSAGWLERTVSPASVRSLYRFKTDRVRVVDDFESVPEW